MQGISRILFSRKKRNKQSLSNEIADKGEEEDEGKNQKKRKVEEKAKEAPPVSIHTIWFNRKFANSSCLILAPLKSASFHMT